MTLPADRSSSLAIVVPMPAARPRRLVQAFVVPIATSVSAITFDEPSAAADDRRRLTALVDGEPLARPLISTGLALRAGGRRHLLLVGRRAEALVQSRVTLLIGQEAVAAIDPDWLQPPVADETALVTGLSNAGRRRLLKLFLTTGASLFGSDDAADFTDAAYRLLDLLSVPASAPVAWCPAATAGTFLSYRVDDGADLPPMGQVVCLASGQVKRLAGCKLAAERMERGSLLHLHLPHAVPAGGSLIVLGECPLHLRAPEAAAAPRALVPWLARRDAGTRAWVEGLVEPAADADPVAAALMRELSCADTAQPTLRTKYLAATPAGILHAFELSDPLDLVRAVRIERGGAVQDLEPDREGITLPAITGYTAVPRRSRGSDGYRLRLVYRSGRVRTVAEGQLARYRGEIPPGFTTEHAEATMAVARARLSLERSSTAAATVTFGTPPDQPSLSVIAAVGENLDLIRARAAMLFAEPAGRDVELVYHGTDGALGSAARVAIANAAAVFGISHRVVTLPERADAAARLLAALGVTRGAGILVLGAEVLPEGPGWLAPWLCRLVSARPILGGTLLDPAGAVIHAGGMPGDRGLRGIGLPAEDLPDAPAAATMLVSADCVGLTRMAADLVRESATPYPDPGVMLAETVARLRAEGKEAVTLLRCRFVRDADAPADHLAEAVDSAALALVLKRSFSPSGDDGQA